MEGIANRLRNISASPASTEMPSKERCVNDGQAWRHSTVSDATIDWAFRLSDDKLESERTKRSAMPSDARGIVFFGIIVKSRESREGVVRRSKNAFMERVLRPRMSRERRRRASRFIRGFALPSIGASILADISSRFGARFMKYTISSTPLADAISDGRYQSRLT